MGLGCANLRIFVRPAPLLFESVGCGCSSGVEHNLAKGGVEGSNPFARSNPRRRTSAAWRPIHAHHRRRLGAIRGPRCPGLSATKAPGRARPRCKEPRATEHSTENVAKGFDLVVAGARDYRAAK
jgi:hypothetical protein